MKFGSKAHLDALKEMRTARERTEVTAENLTDEEIREAMSFAHLDALKEMRTARERTEVTAENLTDEEIREAMALGDTPLTGNGFVHVCRVVLGARGLGPFVPCSLNGLRDAEQRIAAVINARKVCR